jgi:flagellar basal-body rod modification protein FlgD
MSIIAVSQLPSATAAAAAAAASSTSTSASSAASLNIDFAQYLQILTAQLQNQDPTNATDPNQFTQELVQMGGVQQQITTNQELTQLINSQSSTGLAMGANYIGNYVQANSSNGEFPLESGVSEFGYTLAGAAASATVNVEDASGNVVAQLAGPTAAGQNYIAWNGLAADGTTQEPDGIYTFSVAAMDSNGNAVASSNPVALFHVTSVQSNADGTLQLLAGSLSLDSTDVTGLYTASTLPTTTFASETQNSTTG